LAEDPLDRDPGPNVQPTAQLNVAIGVGKRPAPVVAAGWDVVPKLAPNVPSHIEIAGIQKVLMHVNEHQVLWPPQLAEVTPLEKRCCDLLIAGVRSASYYRNPFMAYVRKRG
jgi:hypothetical protein